MSDKIVGKPEKESFVWVKDKDTVSPIQEVEGGELFDESPINNGASIRIKIG